MINNSDFVKITLTHLPSNIPLITFQFEIQMKYNLEIMLWEFLTHEINVKIQATTFIISLLWTVIQI